MTEYTRDIKPVDYQAPQFAPPSGSVGQDIANVAQVGLEAYGMFKNKQREANLDVMLGQLGQYEVDLAKNGLSRSQKLLKLDEKIKELAPDASNQNYLRARLAQKRGGFVQQQFIAEQENKELQRQQMVESDFQTAVASSPQLLSQYKRNPDGTVNEEDKLKVISEFEDMRIREYQRSKNEAIAQEKLARGGEGALQGAVSISQNIQGRISDIFAPTSAGLVQALNNLKLTDPTNMQAKEELLNNARNTLRVARNTVESQFNSSMAGLVDGKPRQLLEKNKESALAEFDSMIGMMESTDLDSLDALTQEIETIEKGLQLRGLQNFPFVSMMKQLLPNSSPYLTQALMVKHGEIQEAALSEAASGLMSMDSSTATLQFGKQMKEYLETGDTEKASDLVLETTYQFAKDTITKMPTRDLTAGEVDKISGGLLGILQEAANTDDPKQIKEATTLLNSPNFEQFFKQLPEERKAPMGRFISAFNQDVLIDSTDGLFKKMGEASKDSTITYDATQGKFVSGGTKTSALLQKDRPVFQYRNVNKVVKEANTALEMIRKNAQYDPVTQDSKQLIDTMIAEKLPEVIKVDGKLDVYTAKEVAKKEVEGDKDTIRTNKQILEDLQRQIDMLSSDSLRVSNDE